jgi:RNA polymerase sigma factor FliA
MPDAHPRAPRSDDPRLVEAIKVLDAVARGVARQMGGRCDLDDLKGYAHEAVTDVVARFDESRGVTFRGWARLRLRGAIFDGLRKETGLPRGVAARLRALESTDLYVDEKSEELSGANRPTDAQQADAKLETFLRGMATAYAAGLVAGDGGSEPSEAEPEDPETQAGRSEARKLLERALDDLGEPEGTLLRRHYFMDEDLQDAAAHLGLSKSWGSRLHARAIEKLSKRLGAIRGAI